MNLASPDSEICRTALRDGEDLYANIMKTELNIWGTDTRLKLLEGNAVVYLRFDIVSSFGIELRESTPRYLCYSHVYCPLGGWIKKKPIDLQ